MLSGNIDWKAGTSLSAVDSGKFAFAIMDTMLNSALVMSISKELAESVFCCAGLKNFVIVAFTGTESKIQTNAKQNYNLKVILNTRTSFM